MRKLSPVKKATKQQESRKIRQQNYKPKIETKKEKEKRLAKNKMNFLIRKVDDNDDLSSLQKKKIKKLIKEGKMTIGKIKRVDW